MEQTGQQLKEEGQARVIANSLTFKELALEVVREIAGKGIPFMFDEVRIECEKRQIKPNHCNAWGALPKQAVAAGIIKLVTDVMPSQSSIRTAHARKLAWWIETTDKF